MSARRIAAALAGGVVVSVSLATVFAGPARAGYVVQGIASAQGVHVTVVGDGIPIFSTPVDASEPLAAAAVDARGDSVGQAAYPYGGDTATYGVTGAVAPDLPAGVSPTVPANETSSYPSTPSSKLDGTAYQLDAESAEYTSSGTAVSSADASNVPGGALTGSGGTNLAHASVTTVPATGMVTAASNSSASGLSMGPLVLGQVSSFVTMTRLPGQAPTRSVGTSIGRSSVMGQTVDITSAGITAPAGASTGVPDESGSLNQALSAAGITVTYLAEIDTPDGTVAPGVEVSQVHTDATTGQRTDTTYIFGQASASVTAGGAPDAVFAAPDTSTTAPFDSPGPVSPEPSTTAPRRVTQLKTPSAAKTSGVVASTGSSTSGPIAPMTTDAAGAITAPPVSVASAPATVAAPSDVSATPGSTLVAERRRAGDEALSASGTSFYLVLIGAGIAILASGSILRALGVRLLWTR